MVIDDDRQFHHIFLFQFVSIGETEDIAVFARGGGEVENKRRVEVLQHLHTEVAFGIVALVHYHHRIQCLQHTHQLQVGVAVGIFAHYRFKRLQVAVFLIHFAVVLFSGAQTVETHNENAKVLLHHRK